MKRILIFLIIIFCSNIAFSQDSLLIKNVEKKIELNQEEVELSKIQSEDLGVLSLLVNSVNNIITAYGIFLAALTVFLALFGFFGYHSITKKVRKSEKLINKKIQEFDIRLQKIISLENEIYVQKQYVNKSHSYIYDSLTTFANEIENKEKAKSLLRNIILDFHVVNLYCSDEALKFAALAYLQERGSQNIIEHIEHVSNHDINEENRKWASKITGIIETREQIQQESQKSQTENTEQE